MESALVGAVGALFAVAIGAFLSARREQRLWLRREKQRLYSDFLRVATPKWESDPLPTLLPKPGALHEAIENASHDLHLIASVEVQQQVAEILNDLEAGMEHGMAAGHIQSQHIENVGRLLDAMRRDVGSRQWTELLPPSMQNRLRSMSPFHYRR